VAWWGWLLIGWAVLATAGAVWVGLALRIADERDWIRRGGYDRRAQVRRSPV